MKSIIRYLLVAVVLGFAMPSPCAAAASDEPLFVYPVPPDTMVALQPRCDFIVSRFWDRCNFSTAFREPQRLHRAMGDWFYIMQHASADTVHSAIDRLLARFAKKGNETLTLASIAEEWLYSDTAEIRSDEVYRPFAAAAATNRKISNADKARFQAQLQIIDNSSLGTNVPDLEFVRADGTTGHLSEISGASVLLFFNDPECVDCNMARVRLGADYNANELIRRGELAIVCIYPGEADEQWKATAQHYPANWTVAAVPDADLWFDLRITPSFYFLNSRHKVLAKDLDLDYLLAAFRVANTRANRAAAQ